MLVEPVDGQLGGGRVVGSSAPDPWLIARAGIPRRWAVLAAPTVPDTSATGPMFCPTLMPDITRSGSTPSSSRATSTESAGNPTTAVAGKPLVVCSSLLSSGPAVVLSPVPDWLVAGATTVTSTPGSTRRASTRASMPTASNPSSLVTRICSGGGGSVEADVSPDPPPAASSSSPPHAPSSSTPATTAAATRPDRARPIGLIGRGPAR